MLGTLLLVLIGVLVVLGGIGLWMNRREPMKETRDDTENVVDLRDRFNRARYMDRDWN